MVVGVGQELFFSEHVRNHRAAMDALANPTQWRHVRNHRAAMDALANHTQWSHVCNHRAAMDALANRTQWSHVRNHRAAMDALGKPAEWRKTRQACGFCVQSTENTANTDAARASSARVYVAVEPLTTSSQLCFASKPIKKR